MRDKTEAAPNAQPKQALPKASTGELLFEIFCATIFLGMIGLVFYNAFLRYVFSSSYAPSEEWARFLFIYITFFGAIEAFYRKKHIAVDMFVDMLSGCARKTVDIIAQLLSMAAMLLLLCGGIVYVLQTMDTYTVATNLNMALVNGTLPIMAMVALLIQLRDFVRLLRKPAAEFIREPDELPDEVKEIIELSGK
jgi:TRAP-type transport system small permease protein